MSFGIANSDLKISRNTNNSVQVAAKSNGAGVILEETSFGGASELTEEEYTDAPLTNAATNGQVGNSTTGIVTAHSLIESNTDYQRSNKTTRTVLATTTT